MDYIISLITKHYCKTNNSCRSFVVNCTWISLANILPRVKRKTEIDVYQAGSCPGPVRDVRLQFGQGPFPEPACFGVPEPLLRRWIKRHNDATEGVSLWFLAAGVFGTERRGRDGAFICSRSPAPPRVPVSWTIGPWPGIWFRYGRQVLFQTTVLQFLWQSRSLELITLVL